MAVVAAGRTTVVREIHSDDSQVWDDFVAHAPGGDVHQSWAWGEFKRRYGWRPVRLALVAEGRIHAAAQVLLRPIARLPLAYVPGGPVAPADRPDLYGPLYDAIHRLARRRAIFLRVEPRVVASEPDGAMLERWLRDRGFRPSPRHLLPYEPRATLVTDLRGGPDAVLARMRPKTRYNVRLAARRGVRVRFATGEADVAQFHRLMLGTGVRQSIPAQPLEFYRAEFAAFRRRDQAALLLAEFAGRVVSGVMVVAYGPTGFLLHSASSAEHMREHPNNLTWWHGIQWCMERGCVRYDHNGIPEEALRDGDGLAQGKAQPHVEAWGVYLFKRGFGGEKILYPGPHDYPYIPSLYRLYCHQVPLLMRLADRLYYGVRGRLSLRRYARRAPAVAPGGETDEHSRRG